MKGDININTKYYLIGAFNNGKQAQRYFDSLNILGNTVEPIIIQYLRQGKFDKIKKPDNVKLIKYKKEYPGNTGKHKDFYELISPLLERDTWCIFTDMHDVIFQAPLPDPIAEDPFWSKGVGEFEPDILVASEAKKFGEINYWKEIFPQEVWEWDVYNVGCFVMKRDVLRKFWEYLYLNWMGFYGWYKQGTIMRIGSGDKFPFNIPFHERVKVEMAIMFNAHYDTLCFNQFIRGKNIEEVSGLFGCYAYQVDQGVVKYLDGKLYQDDKLISIAHFNGSSKGWLPKKIKKGGTK